jgi:hypothetical protein
MASGRPLLLSSMGMFRMSSSTAPMGLDDSLTMTGMETMPRVPHEKGKHPPLLKDRKSSAKWGPSGVSSICQLPFDMMPLRGMPLSKGCRC